MFLTNNILIKIVFLLLTIVFSIGLSVHPLFVNEISPLLSYLKVFGKLILIVSFMILFMSVVKQIKSLHIYVLFFVFILLIIILTSIIQVIINNILIYPSPIILCIFIFMYILFYALYFTKSKIYIIDSESSTNNIKKIISIFTLFLFLSMSLEILVKYSPYYTDIKYLLRESGNIVFPWRLTGFLFDANRWAVILLLILAIFSYLKKELKLANKPFEITLYIYLLLTLSKTAFFILFVVFLIDIRSFLKIFKLKSLFFIVTIILIFLSSLTLVDYNYNNSALERRIDFTVESMLHPSEARTLHEREETYIAALISIDKNLLAGTGYLNFKADTSVQNGISVHNTPLALMAYFGVINGIFIYLFIFVFPIVLLFLKYKFNKELLTLLFVTSIFFNMISLAHDLILILVFYITLIIYEITKRIKFA